MTATSLAVPRSAGVARPVAVAAVIAQLVFVLTWLVAAAWQGARYSVLAHSISDMYAVTAPAGAVLVVVFTICGAVTVLFAAFALRPAFRSAGWPALVGVLLLGLSIFGLGDLLTPFERLACRLADAGCTAESQVANAGGQLDSSLSTFGVGLYIAAAIFLSVAMRRVTAWARWSKWFIVLAIAMAVFFAADGLTAGIGLAGLFERLLAVTGAAGIAALGVGILRQGKAR